MESEVFVDKDDEDDDDDEWEDIEEWKLDTPKENHVNRTTVSSNHKNHITTSSVSKLQNETNHNHIGPMHPITFNHGPINPLNHNCLSAYNNAYGLNGSLSVSSESVPVQQSVDDKVSKAGSN